jgi:hypothetical protein
MNLGSPAGVGYDRWIDYQNNTSSQVTWNAFNKYNYDYLV